MLAEREEVRLEIIDWTQKYDGMENYSTEKLAISTTIAALRVRFASMQRKILEMRL